MELLLHFNGNDEDISTIDSSINNHTINFNGNAQLDTAQKKWGATSLLLDGTDDYLSISDSSSWDICGSNSDDWTIDLWVKYPTYDKDVTYCGQYENSNNRWTFGYNGASESAHRFYLKSHGLSAIVTPAGGTISDTNWHHVAMCKVGSIYAIYLDGIQVCYLNDSSIDTLSGDFYIGRNPIGSYDFNGHIDEFRITHSNIFNASPVVGLTNTITVPTGEYGEIEGLFDLNNDFRMVGAAVKVDFDNDFRMSLIHTIIDTENDFRMVGVLERIDTDVDFRSVIETKSDLSNKIKTTKLVIGNIVQKFNSCIEVVKNITNVISFNKQSISDVSNDIRFQKKDTYDIDNDFRMIWDWQITDI